MRCSHCKQNGISALSKSLLLFSIPLRCKKCGTQFVHYFVLKAALQTALAFVVFYGSYWALIQSSSLLLWSGVLGGILILMAVCTVVPLKQSHQLLRFKNRDT